MAGALNRMPHHSGHLVCHRFVDGVRYESIILSLPHVDSSFDGGLVESPTPIEEFSVTDQPVGTLSESAKRIGDRHQVFGPACIGT
jgi:hypothetical protein